MRQRADGLQYDGTYPPVWDEFVDWYCDPERPCTLKEWARQHNIGYERARKWVNDTPHIRRLIEMRYAELNVNPERIQSVVNALHKAASAGDTKAASLYLQYVERLQPTKIIIEDARVSALTDEQLDAELAALIKR